MFNQKKIKQAGTWGRRNGPVSKSAYCMSLRTRVQVQTPHNKLDLVACTPVTPVLWRAEIGKLLGCAGYLT